MELKLEVAKFLMVLEVMVLVELDFQEEKLVLDQSLVILLELGLGLEASHLPSLKLLNMVSEVSEVSEAQVDSIQAKEDMDLGPRLLNMGFQEDLG